MFDDGRPRHREQLLGVQARGAIALATGVELDAPHEGSRCGRAPPAPSLHFRGPAGHPREGFRNPLVVGALQALRALAPIGSRCGPLGSAGYRGR